MKPGAVHRLGDGEQRLHAGVDLLGRSTSKSQSARWVS